MQRRRDRINQRMRTLQKLLPTASKVNIIPPEEHSLEFWTFFYIENRLVKIRVNRDIAGG